MRPLAAVPAEVVALAAGSGPVSKSTSSQAALADVADHQVAGQPVEREAPGVSQPVAPDLVAAVRASVRRTGCPVGPCTPRDRSPADRFEDLPEQGLEVLGVAVGIALGPAVPGRDVEVAIGSELELAAVVVLGTATGT